MLTLLRGELRVTTAVLGRASCRESRALEVRGYCGNSHRCGGIDCGHTTDRPADRPSANVALSAGDRCQSSPTCARCGSSVAHECSEPADRVPNSRWIAAQGAEWSSASGTSKAESPTVPP